MSNAVRWHKRIPMLLGFLLLAVGSLQAGHNAGIDISYECINACTIRVQFRAYRDCSSPIGTISPIGTVTIASDSGCAAPTMLGAWLNVSNVEVTPVCPGTPTRCTSPSAAINGFMEHHWTADFDFCSANCSTYTINFQTCCRNSSVNTIFGPTSVGQNISTTVNPFLSPCNSSPVFNNPPVLMLCEGQSYVFDQGATDPDGDSLSYVLGPCLSQPGMPVPYLSFASPSVPLGPNWSVILNGSNGYLTIGPDFNGSNPGSAMTGVVCIYVSEWRNGQLINTIMRDLQLTVVPCVANDAPTTPGITNLSGGVQMGNFAVKTCLGATLCFDIKVFDSDTTQVQTVWWNQSLAALGATFTLASNPSITDTVVGSMPIARFCWTPPATGSYSFTVIMRDDACPIYGIGQYSFQIDVGEVTLAANDSVTGCKEVGLCAQVLGANLPVHYNWAGPGGLSQNPDHLDSCLVHTYPTSGNYPYTLSVTDAIGCTATFSDTIVIPNNVLADAGPDMVACANQPLIIGNPPQPSQYLIYNWSPNVGMANSNQAQPTVTLSNFTTGPLMQQYVLSIMDTVTRCFDQDSMLVTVYPLPSSPFNLVDTVCQYQVVGAAYLGWSGPSATYDWTFAGGYPSTASGQGPQQVGFSAPGPHEVTLTVTDNGCVSPTERDTIFVRTNPVADILPVAGQCLVSNSFNFTNAGIFGSGAVHAWTFWPNANPSTSSLQNPTGVVFGTAGPKWVTLTTSEDGCNSLVDSLLVEVYPDPNVNWGVVGGVQCFDGNSHQFVAAAGNGAGASYLWSFQDGVPASSTDTLPVVTFTSPGPKVVTLYVNANNCTGSRTDTIMVYPEPSVSAGPDMAFCEGDGGVGILATATGGTAPFYYTWTCAGICGIDSMYDDDPHVNPPTSTAYAVQVTDANGCTTAWDTVQVTIHPKPIVHAGPDLRLCGLAAPCQVLMPTVSGTGPFSYEWFPATGLNDSSLFNPCARPDTTTTYVLIATELTTGCSSDFNTLDTSSTAVVHVNPVPVAYAGPDIHICHGDSVQFQGVGSNAGPAYQYEWTPMGSLSNPAAASPWAWPSMTTIYTLLVWSNGCPSIADSLLVDVHTQPSVDAGWDREICLGETTMLDATAGGDSTAQYTFQWSTTLGLNNPYLEDPLASPPTSTTYFVVATSTWGCESTLDSVTVSLLPTPIADAGRNLSVCEGQSVHLEGGFSYGSTPPVADPSQIIYSWWPATGGMDDSTLAQPTVQPTVSGMYHFAVMHATCRTEDSVFVTVIPDLGAQVAADTSVICAGDSVQLQALGGFGGAAYQWFPPQAVSDPAAGAPTAFGTDSTLLTLILSEAGCHDTAYMQLDVIPSPDVAYLHSDPSGCAPLTISLLQNSSVATAYVWDFGDGSPVSNAPSQQHTYAQPGDYMLQFSAVHTGGCSAEAAPLSVHVEAGPLLDVLAEPAPPAILYLPAATLSLHDRSLAAAAWRWDLGDGFWADGQHVVHTFTQPGIYQVTLRATSLGGCQATLPIGPFEVRIPDLFIPNVFSPNGDGVNDRFLVEYQGDQSFSLEIHDRWGNAVYQGRVKTQGWDGLVGSEPAPDGAYYYHLRIGDKEYAGELSLWR